MIRTEFFQAVLADTGVYCAVGIISGKVRTRFAPDIATLEKEIDTLCAAGADTYFACATFTEATKRTADNASMMKSFWLDLDCGTGKPYPTQEDALAALGQFCTDLTLPAPLVVNSGRGVHAYWPLTQAIPKSAWKPVADRLKDICQEKNLHADPSVTADAARILRAPGTFNLKDPANPLNVDLWFGAEPIDPEEFVTKIGFTKPVVSESDVLAGAIRTEMDETTKALLGNSVSRYATIQIHNAEGTGCAQLKYIEENQEDVEEPLWRAGLSIANHCVDKDTAIHAISDKYSNYNAVETVTKANLTKGPYVCTSFENINPNLCKGCAHKGKITSPIQLGKEILVATEEDNVVQTIDADKGDLRTYNIPTYPFPFFRGKNGGIYKKADVNSKDDEGDKLIYENDFYIVKRLHDPADGEVLWARLHLPRDGVREFSIPLKHVLAKDKFRDAVAEQGMPVLGKSVDDLMFYVTRWVKDMQVKGQAEKVRTQFGWTSDNTFIVGDREITANGLRYAPPSSTTLSICPILEKKGSLDEWKRIVSFYANPGMEVQAFALFMSFGTPLLKFTPMRGGIVNLMSNGSGTGKTTAQMVANSVWGQPQDLLLQNEDTYNSKIFRMGVLNNIIVTLDEITNMREEHISDFAYASTQGRGKNRMQSQTNAERINNTTWATNVLSSSNSSLYDKLYALKAFPEGEMMRILELRVERDLSHSKQFTDALFSGLQDNYGVAAEPYMQYVCANIDAIMSEFKNIQASIDKAAGLSQRERFWSNQAALAITGGVVAHRLGLHDIDPKPVYKWIIQELIQLRGGLLVGANSSSASIGAYIANNINNVLVIRDKPNDNGTPVVPIREPKGPLLIRYEVDTRHIYLILRPFKEWCAKNQISYRELMNSLNKDGINVEEKKKRMSKGTAVNPPPVNALMIEDIDSQLFDIDEIAIASETEETD